MAYDFGIKHNIMRRLAAHNCRITIVPARYPTDKVLDMQPDGIFLSNGPVSISACPCSTPQHHCQLAWLLLQLTWLRQVAAHTVTCNPWADRGVCPQHGRF